MRLATPEREDKLIGRDKARILAAGGQNEKDTSRLTYRFREWVEGTIGDRPLPSTKTAEVFEFDPGATGQSRWQPGYKTMHHPRILCDATLLADGTVLISGGSQEGWTNENPHPREDRGSQDPLQPVYHAELFDPEEQVFKKAARAHTDRRYHSVALLLPDGTVLKAGSTGGFDAGFYPELACPPKQNKKSTTPGSAAAPTPNATSRPTSIVGHALRSSPPRSARFGHCTTVKNSPLSHTDPAWHPTPRSRSSGSEP